MADGVKVGEAYVEVHPDTSAFARELDDQVGGIGKKASSKLGDLIAAGAFTAGLAKATDAAKALEQAVGGTSAVFKENSAQIDRFAKSAAELVGLSEEAARSLTSQLGGALKGYGFSLDEATEKSQQLVTLGADLAATYGGTTKEAVEALSAALRGEFDPLERYAVAINQNLIDQKAVALGLATSTSSVDQHARAQAALSLITERSADAQGQFGREAGTAAGAAEIASAKAENSAANLGKNFLPIYTRIAETVGTAAEVFGRLPGPVQTAAVALAALTALSGPLGNTAGRARDLASAIHSGELGSSKLAAAGTAAAGLAIGYGIWADAMREARQAADALLASSRQANADQGFDAYVARGKRVQQQTLELRAEFEKLRTDAQSGLDPVEALGALGKVENFKQLADSLQAEAQSVNTLTTQAEALATASGRSRDETIKWLVEQQALGRSFGSTEEAIDAYTKKTEESTSAAEKDEEATKRNAEAHKVLADRVNQAYDAFQSIIGVSLDYTEAQRDVTRTAQELVELQRSGTANANDFTAKTEELVRASEAQARAAVAEAEAQAELEGRTLSNAEQTRIYVSELQKLAEKYPALAPALQPFLDQLAKIPDTKTVDVEVKLKDLTGGLLEGLKGPNPLANVPLLGKIAGRAGGGPVDAGSPYLVGEKGPELIVPGKSGTVVPNAAGVNLTVNVQGMGIRDEDALELVSQRLSIALQHFVGAS